MLVQVEEALKDHFVSFLSKYRSELSDVGRVSFSLVNDRETHLKEIEKARHRADPNVSGVLFPAFVIVRIGHKPVRRANSARPAVGTVELSRDNDTGDVRTAKYKFIEIDYQLVMYDTCFEGLTDLFEYWSLNLGDCNTVFSYILPDVDNTQWDSVMTFEDPEIAASTVGEYEDEDGLIYTQVFPFTIRTIILSPVGDEFVILDPISNVHIISHEQDFPS